MVQERNKALARKAIEIWNTGDIDEVDQIYSPHCVNHQHHHPMSKQSLHGRGSWKQFIQEFRTAFPDYQDVIQDQIAEGDRVVTRLISQGTHNGPLMGIPPTHKKLFWTAIIIDRIEDGLIAESWINWDMYGMLEDMGVVTIKALAK